MVPRYTLSSCVRPSVCPSVTSQYCMEMTERIDLIFGCKPPPTYPTLSYKKIWVTPKIGYFPSELCPKTPGLKNSPRQVDRIVNKTRRRLRRWSLLTTHINGQVVAVYCESVNCNSLTLLLRFVIDLLYNLFSTAESVARSVCGGKSSCYRCSRAVDKAGTYAATV